MTYLAHWRLHPAARSLESPPRGVAEIAADVGYESEAAFNRAFKREFGKPPGRYRADRRKLSAKYGRGSKERIRRSLSQKPSAKAMN